MNIIHTEQTDVVKIDVFDDLSCEVTKLATGQITHGRLHFREHELYCILVDDFYIFKSSSIGIPGSKRIKNLQRNVEAVADTPRTKFNKFSEIAKKAGFYYRFVDEEEFEDGVGATVGHNWTRTSPGNPHTTWYTKNQVKKEIGL